MHERKKPLKAAKKIFFLAIHDEETDATVKKMEEFVLKTTIGELARKLVGVYSRDSIHIRSSDISKYRKVSIKIVIIIKFIKTRNLKNDFKSIN